MSLKTGDPLPAVVGETQIGRIDLADFQGKKWVVLWSYPKDGTSG